MNKTRNAERGVRSSGKLTFVILSLFLAGCTTTPVIPRDARASWDGGLQNSGLIANLGEGWFIVTPHWRDRYVALAAKHGALFVPPVTNDFGVMPYTNGTLCIDGQRAVQFIKMNRAEKAKPTP